MVVKNSPYASEVIFGLWLTPNVTSGAYGKLTRRNGLITYRSLEILILPFPPVSDYEVLEIREARMIFKKAVVDPSIKIGSARSAKEATLDKAEPLLSKVEHPIPVTKAASIMPMYTEARAVNDLKQIVGVYRDGKCSSKILESDIRIPLGGNHWRLLFNSEYDKIFCYKSFLWEKEAYIKMGTLGGQFSSPCDISNFSQIVGASHLETKGKKEVLHAFIWENGTMKDLNDLLVNRGDGQEIELKIATAINNLGYIVGVAIINGNTTSFLLIPQSALKNRASIGSL
jgi:probable HAF family extracellular repeat protein